MSNFSFPPPPPPPPKAVPISDFDSFESGGKGRGRGGVHHDRGRGSGHRGRGRGSSLSSSPYHNANNGQQYGQQRSNPNFAPIRGTAEHSRGQKRKRDDVQSRQYNSGPRKSEVAPAVPSFGTPIVVPNLTPFTSARSLVQSTASTPNVPAKRKADLFGLTAYDDESSASEGDDDEATMAAASSNP